MSKRKTSLSITRDYDGTYLISASYSDEDANRKKSEVIQELIKELKDSPLATLGKVV